MVAFFATLLLGFGRGELATVFGCAAWAKKEGGERDSATKLGDDLAAVTVGRPKRKRRRRSVNFSPPWRGAREEEKKCFGTLPPFYVFLPIPKFLTTGHFFSGTYLMRLTGRGESALPPKIWRRDDRGSPSPSERYDLQKKEVLFLRPRCEMCDRFFRLFCCGFLARSPWTISLSSLAPGERGRRKGKVVSLALWRDK